jgi:HNH endonuclease
MLLIEKSNPLHAYISARVTSTSPSLCWEWIRSLTHNGYGQAFDSKTQKNVRAHRFSYELFVGEIPHNHLVLHSCDNRKCVNPNHLFLGLPKDNTKDMMDKNRHRKRSGNMGFIGSKTSQAKLSESQVLEIRDIYAKKTTGNKEAQKQIGLQYGVSGSCIQAIVNRNTWTHI